MNNVEMWNQRYNTEDYVYGKKPNDFLIKSAESVLPGNVLCLAEGEGRNATYMASKGHKVLAVDSSSVGLKKAQSLANQLSVSIDIIESDLAVFDIQSEKWDTIISIFCHLPKDIRNPLHQKVVKGLKPGGILILEAYTPLQLKYNTGGPKDPDLLYDLNSLTKELDGLILTHSVETVRDIYEGLLHVGEGSVVQIIATKPERR